MPDTKRTVEQRIEALEHFQSLVMGSRLGGEIRGLALREKQAAIEAGWQNEKIAAREAAGPARKAGVAKFITECLEIGPGGETAEFALTSSYRSWAAAAGLSKDEVADEGELLAAVRGLPDVQSEVVRAGPMSNRMPGLIGVRVTGEHRHPHDAVGAQQKPPTSTFGGTSSPTTTVAGARMI